MTTSTPKMRAVVQRSFGGPEVLEIVEVDRPRPVVNEVLVKVHAAGVNPVDAQVWAGLVPMLGPPPITVGWDDYRAVDFVKAVAEAVAEVDVVVDTVGGDTAVRSLDTLRPGGVCLTIVEMWNTDLARLTAARGFRFVPFTTEPDCVGLAALAGMVEAGALRPHVSEVVALDDVIEAHRLIDGGSVTGKVVLTP